MKLTEKWLEKASVEWTGFENNINLPVHDWQKYFQGKKVKNPKVCMFCKLFIYTHLAQWSYGWDVLNIVQTYQSDLTQIKPLQSLYMFAWSNYGLNFFNITHTYRCGNTMSYQVSTSYILRFLRYSPDKIL